MQLQKLPSYIVTLAGVVILGVVSFSVNQPTQAFTAKSTVQVPLNKSLATQYRQLAIAPLGNSSILLAQISPVGSIAVILVVCGIVTGVILVPGIVQIGQNEIGIERKKFGRPTSHLIAFDEKEAGWQAKILSPGLYWRLPWLYEIHKEEAVCIAPDKIGIVEAKDGAPLSSGQNFGKVVECNKFQDAQAFFKNQGQRGKQRAILNIGTYRINTKLFAVEIRDVIRIHPDQVGIVEAKDGAPLSSGQNFGNVVECNDFQDAQAFFEKGGQRGKQLAILKAAIYQINTELFKIQRDSVIRIQTGEVGIVEARDGALLPPGQNFGKLVKCNDFQDAQAFFDQGGQKGKQLAILKAGTYQINTALFKVRTAPIVKVLPGEIALVVAQGGTPLSPERILGRAVECNNFEDAQAFITNGGQRGKQLAILRAGEYQINTDLFTIVTTENATEYGMKPEYLKLCTIGEDKIGIVTTLDGLPIPEGEVAGSFIEGHDKFQNGQKFIDAGGFRGLQEEFLQEGSWSLNPWFVKVEQVPLTEISADKVGVITSYIGKNVDNASTKESRLVDEGYKGVQKIPLRPTKYAINTRVKSVDIVPTNEIILNWSDEPKPAENYDANLKALKLRSKDGFTFDIRVTQVISIAEEDAPRMILRVGAKVANNSNQTHKNTAIKNLVSRVLGPMIDSFFRNSAQGYEALDFQDNRVEIQRGAEEHIKAALNAYGVKAISTLINEIDPPDELEELVKQSRVFEEERKTIEAEKLTEQKRQGLIEERERTKAQAEIVKAERDLEIADLKAKAKIKQVEADAEAKRRMDDVDLNTKRQQLDMDADYQERLRNIDINELQQIILALSPELYAKIESEKAWSHALAQLKIDMPEIFIGGSSGSSPGADALQAGTMQFAWMDMLRDMLRQREPKQIDMSPKVEVLNPVDNG
ncbi:MAG: SPFH domain-containing protein [Nostoc sp. DedQUE04]|uniref:SPFH domain-containing protein n=1 Tax=Nostoc sp. DedQUE04 TaxID=3075390 RepID=UPI002AD34F59|nr:SPFH domain-containing protein [Nostoc sp. DedQUE04]MDZ8141015.1 SPFH domain-containing protein [Nostoc sp. DedQUE04]